MREPDAGWRDRLTVIITTSPLPRHPCSSMLEAILLSLRGFGGLAGCRMLIVADCPTATRRAQPRRGGAQRARRRRRWQRTR